jgi:hypothetical protein
MLQFKRGVSHCWILLALFALVISLVSCGKKQEQPAATEAAQKTFASPDDAGKALVDAAKSDNRDAMLAIFGPGLEGPHLLWRRAGGQGVLRWIREVLRCHASLAKVRRQH